jgi:hypothetical protein
MTGWLSRDVATDDGGECVRCLYIVRWMGNRCETGARRGHSTGRCRKKRGVLPDAHCGMNRRRSCNDCGEHAEATSQVLVDTSMPTSLVPHDSAIPPSVSTASPKGLDLAACGSTCRRTMHLVIFQNPREFAFPLESSEALRCSEYAETPGHTHRRTVSYMPWH